MPSISSSPQEEVGQSHLSRAPLKRKRKEKREKRKRKEKRKEKEEEEEEKEEYFFSIRDRTVDLAVNSRTL